MCVCACVRVCVHMYMLFNIIIIENSTMQDILQ